MSKQNLYLLTILSIICLACSLRADRQGQLLTHVMNLVENQYYCPGEDAPVDRDSLAQRAMIGMLHTLDPYSAYLPPVAFDKMNESINQTFAGIGASIIKNPKTLRPTVVSLIYSSPAQKAGLKPGDVILAVDGKPIQKQDLSVVTKYLRGLPGTFVTLKIERPNVKEPFDLKIQRESVKIDSVLGDRRLEDGRWTFFLPNSKGVAYLRITSFGKRTAEEVQKLVVELNKLGMRALILDLRGNPGGTLKSAIELCSLFMPEDELVVSIKSRTLITEMRSVRVEGFNNVPVAVLIDGQSASASEIVAACLQDRAGKPLPDGSLLRLKVIGSRSFGKGTVQDMYSLPEGQGAIKFTIAGYIRPNGKNIHRNEQTTKTDQWGVRPDEGFEINLSEKGQQRLDNWRQKREMAINLFPEEKPSPFDDPAMVDPCIKKALEFFDAQ